MAAAGKFLGTWGGRDYYKIRKDEDSCESCYSIAAGDIEGPRSYHESLDDLPTGARQAFKKSVSPN